MSRAWASAPSDWVQMRIEGCFGTSAWSWARRAAAEMLQRVSPVKPVQRPPASATGSPIGCPISCAPVSSPSPAATKTPTTLIGYAPIRPSSWPPDGCPTAAMIRSRPSRAGRTRPRRATSSAWCGSWGCARLGSPLRESDKQGGNPAPPRFLDLEYSSEIPVRLGTGSRLLAFQSPPLGGPRLQAA